MPLRVEQKNELLIRELLARWTSPGGIVLDLFSGTGTTAVAMCHLGLQGSIVDIDADCYFAGLLARL